MLTVLNSENGRFFLFFPLSYLFLKETKLLAKKFAASSYTLHNALSMKFNKPGYGQKERNGKMKDTEKTEEYEIFLRSIKF